jgi:hypothetical protein
MAEAQDAGEGAKFIVDAISAGTAVGALVGLLPAIAAIFTILWTAIRIYETETVRRLLGRKTANNHSQE